MKHKMGSLKCGENQAILETWSEREGKAVQEFSCVDPGGSGSVMPRSCVPSGDSRYITCQTFQCPSGYSPVMVHIAEEDTQRQGMGFSCIPVEAKQTSPSLWDRLFSGWDTVPG
jgi:hypothetical protein